MIPCHVAHIACCASLLRVLCVCALVYRVCISVCVCVYIVCVYRAVCVYPVCISCVSCVCVQHDDLDLSEDGGVSKAMATVFCTKRRLPYLLTHGMVHLMGFDHETDEEWLRMTSKEDKVLRALAEEFPDAIQLPPPIPCETR